MGEEVDSVKAVYLEVVDKNITSKDITIKDITRAPFAGIYMREAEKVTTKEKALDSFVILSNEKEKALDIFNIMYYNIVTVEIVKDGYSDFWFSRNDTKDQESAFKIVSDVLAHMQKFNRVLQDESVIDVASYKSDQALLSKVAGEHITHTTYGAKKPATGNGVYSAYKAPGSTTTGHTSKKKAVEPAVIKRSRGASKTILKRMFDAVQEISEGKYKAPEFPDMPEIEEKDVAEDTDKDTDDEQTGWYDRGGIMSF